MDSHVIELPRKILVGRNVIDEIPVICKELGVSDSVLVLADNITKKIAGDRIAEAIGADIGIIADANYSELDRIGNENPDINIVVGVGGGRVIDIGKLLAFRREVPFISVPTALSHDGMTSERASINNGNVKESSKARPPIAIIADTDILVKAPYKLTAAGCADAISNYTAVYDWRLGKEQGEYYSEYAASLSLMSADTVVRSAESIKNLEEYGITRLVEALITSGISMSMACSSRPASGSEHLFSHALEQLGSDALHGEHCGVGSILMAHLQEQDWEKIRDSLKSVGAPTTAREMGLDQDMIIEALVRARDVRDRYTILNRKPLDAEKAEELCNTTGVF
jgi:glycerol-1-phosphate dehydrogenase [NAD(P)+]